MESCDTFLVRVIEPNVLIISGGHKGMSRNIGKYYADLGAMVIIIYISLEDHRIVIESLNEEGVTYASISREVCNDDEAREVLYDWLDDCMKFRVVINLMGEDAFNTSRLKDIVESQGGIIYTAV
ncbi:hypothetical protein ASZ90_019926 [hydrocarbon metagenome]|uniref:Uncharacterized protein n=1 Tax=hydrocarbon metagenome TaxID=938273 RepID=A0A0W8E2N7_9ZZZZ